MGELGEDREADDDGAPPPPPPPPPPPLVKLGTGERTEDEEAERGIPPPPPPPPTTPGPERSAESLGGGCPDPITSRWLDELEEAVFVVVEVEAPVVIVLWPAGRIEWDNGGPEPDALEGGDVEVCGGRPELGPWPWPM